MPQPFDRAASGAGLKLEPVVRAIAYMFGHQFVDRNAVQLSQLFGLSWSLHQQYKELFRGDAPDSESLAVGKVPFIECHDDIAAAGDRAFQYQIVVGIGRYWSPKEIESVQSGSGADGVHNFVDILDREPEFAAISFENRFVLQHNRHRNIRPPTFVAELAEQAIRWAMPGTQGGHQDVCVQHDLMHRGRRPTV